MKFPRSQQRYKGTAPFLDLELDRKTFFGRDHESRSLLSLVLAERLVVLFAKSGLGKTSLINAGLAQPLRERGYLPMAVRVGDPTHGPLRSLADGIQNATREAGVECVNAEGTAGEQQSSDTSLWRFFKTTELWSKDDDLLRPVLILDQFEELFTLHEPKARRELIEQLAELVRGRSPERSEDAERLPGDRILDGEPPDLRIVIALREDFLANLEELARDIPGILHNRFRLDPLTLDGARDAIVEPARLADEAFETMPFDFREQAVTDIIAFLGKRRIGDQTVESEDVLPWQLQLICQSLEAKVLTRQESAQHEIEISDADLGGERDMTGVLEGFYDRTLRSIKSLVERRSVRRLCERLISRGGRRLTDDEDEIVQRFNISKELLRRLVDARLLRAEPRLGGTFYELSHDTLVDPILRSKARRRARWRPIVAVAALISLSVGLGLFGYRAIIRAQYQPGFSFQDCPECPQMVVIPAGNFSMGSPESETDRDADEGPQHKVSIARFALGKSEVTRREFAVYAQSATIEPGGCWFWDGKEGKQDAVKNWQGPGFSQTDEDPVVCVNWEDAKGYVDWLSRRADHEYRLASESEWEYAARAKTETSRFWGDNPDSACDFANVADQTLKESYPDLTWPIHDCEDGHVRTAPVGNFQANFFGLNDVLGNVWELTEDCWNANYTGAPGDGSAWVTGNCSARVVRGGSWSNEPRNVRSANRDRNDATDRTEDVGFRVARTLP